MRFNGKSIYDVHRSISIAKEIPPGMPERDINTVSGWDGEMLAGTSYKRGVYIARVNIAGRSADEAWRVRQMLAEWATSSGEKTGMLEPTHWPGRAYDAIVESISDPEFKRGFATVTVTFVLPRPVAYSVRYRHASGHGSASMQVLGSAGCKPIIKKTITAAQSGASFALDGASFFKLNGSLAVGDVIEIDTKAGSVTINGQHAETRVDYTASRWRPGFGQGAHKITSAGGDLEVRWRDEWM